MSRRIALVSSFLPAPANMGPLIRIHRLACGLAQAGEVELYCRVPAKLAEQPLTHQELQIYAAVHRQPYDGPSMGGMLPVYSEAFMPTWLAEDDPLSTRLAEDQRRRPFDAIVCEHLYSANVGLAIRGVPLVLDEHNIESQSFAQIAAAQPRADPKKAQALVQVIREHEQRVWPRMSRITCVSEADAEHIRRHVQRPVHFIPNGVALDDFPFVLPSARTGLTVLFVGSFFWPPNIKAARFLAKEVMPRVWQQQPAARLVLCGARPTIDVALLKRRGIEVTGTVPSVAPYYAEAGVFANALFEGAGTSLKVVEALAAGVPLVSTAVGVRGHALMPGVQYLPAEAADEFAKSILQTFEDRAACDEPARRGRAFAELMDWQRIAAEFAAVVEAAASS